MFFNLTAVGVFLFTILLSCIDAFAAKPVVRAYDDTDTEIFFNENNYALNAGNVTFVLDRDALLPGEFYVYEDGGVLTSVKDYTYVMEAGEDGEMKFVNFYKKKGDELESIGDSPFFVEFADAVRIAPDVAYAEGGNGTPPSLTVGPRSWVHTFLCIDDGENSTQKRITEKTQISFANDGVYKVNVNTMDGKGNRTCSNKLPESIVVDKKPPVITELVTDEESRSEDGAVFGKKVTLSAKVWDERSKTEEICWIVDGEEKKGEKLVINPPFRGSVQVYAKDSAGNTSPVFDFFNELIADDEAPDIKVSQKTGGDGVLKLDITASDSLSGVERIVAKLDGKVISEKKGSKDEVRLDLRDADAGERKVMIYACDRAGNSAEGSVMVKKSDSTAPVIEILGVQDRGVYGNDVDLFIDARDDSGEISSFSAAVFAKDAAGRMIYSRTTDQKKLRISQSGVITVTAKAADPEGNRASSSVTFIVDKDAPVIKGVEKYDKGVFEDFFLEEDPGEMIEDLSSVTYEVYLNGLLYDGREVIKSGNYVLKVSATDEFGRRSEKTADFTVKKEEQENAVQENSISRNSVSRNSISKENSISRNRILQTVISQNRATKNRVTDTKPEERTAQNTLSADTVSKTHVRQDDFFTRFYYDILKLFGLKKQYTEA